MKNKKFDKSYLWLIALIVAVVILAIYNALAEPRNFKFRKFTPEDRGVVPWERIFTSYGNDNINVNWNYALKEGDEEKYETYIDGICKWLTKTEIAQLVHDHK